MNEGIQSARDAAMSILKPTRQELDRGLSLHADAVVCDTYGFAPRAAIDPAACLRKSRRFIGSSFLSAEKSHVARVPIFVTCNHTSRKT